MIIPQYKDFRKSNHLFQNSSYEKASFLDIFTPKRIVEKIYKEIPDDVLFIGYELDNPDEPFFIPFNREKRISILIQGPNGSGKSKLYQNIMYDNLHLRQDRPVLDCGAKLDSQTIRFPNTNPKFVNRIKKFGGRPTGYPYAKYITPEFLNIPGAIGERFSLSVKGLTELIKFSPTIGMNDTFNIFNTNMTDSAGTALMEFFMSEEPPYTIDELSKKIENHVKKNPQVKQLPNQFKMLTYTKRLTDSYISYPKLIKENKILCVEFQIASADENNIQAVFLNNIIQNVMQDRTLSILSNNQKGYLDKPPVIGSDEADIFAGAKTTTSETIRELLTKYREINPQKAAEGINTSGCDLLLATQHLSFLDPYIIAEADYIITAKIRNKSDAEILRNRGLSADDIYFLQHELPYPNTYPKPFAVIFPDNSIGLMYPKETLTWMR